MKTAHLLSSLALVVAVLALLFAWQSGPDAAHGDAAVLDRTPRSTEHLEERLDALAQENRTLRDRLAMIESASTLQERTPIAERFASQEEFAAFRDEVRAALSSLSTGGPLATSLGTSEFRDQLTDTLDEIRQAEVETAIQQKRNARIDGLDLRMPKLEEQLGLTPDQSALMRAALTAQYDRQAELSRRWREGEDSAVLGELKRSDHEAHQAELATFLTEVQLETYRASNRK